MTLASREFALSKHDASAQAHEDEGVASAAEQARIDGDSQITADVSAVSASIERRRRTIVLALLIGVAIAVVLQC